MLKQEIRIIVNGDSYEITVKPRETLLEVLREKLKLTGTKKGCDLGDCGACVVILEGKPISSCLVLAIDVRDKEITTIEGLADGEELHSVQNAFIEYGAIQCGFCTPGMVLTAKAFLDENPNPTEDEIKEAISGNICRCTGYVKIIEAIQSAALNLKP